jgi:protein arginine kinase activator
MAKICNICHEAEATVHLNGLLNDKEIKIDMCEECARKKGVELDPELAFFGFVNSIQDTGARNAAGKAACRGCGTTLDEIKKNGRLGCEKCYSDFGGLVPSLLKHIHGACRYGGKGSPQEKPYHTHGQASVLKNRIEEAVRNEEFELAAHFRDELLNLKK